MSAPDLGTTYLGLELSGPWVVSSCPLTGDVGSMERLEAAGASAVVLPSLFQEQVEHWQLELGRLHDTGAHSQAEAAGYFPELALYDQGLDVVLRTVEEARATLTIPVIASLNGVSREGWSTYASRLESAGAQAIELNLHYLPTDPDESAADVEALLAEQVRSVREAVSVPLAVKLGPYFTSLAHTARRLRAVGADGLVLFNRFLEPDIDLESLEVEPRLELSRPSEMRLPLRWIAVLSATTDLSLAATSGVHRAEDAAKLLLAGADAVMVASTLLQNGVDRLAELRRGLASWIEEHEYESLRQLQGSMNLAHCPDPAAYQRQGYMRALISYSSPLP